MSDMIRKVLDKEIISSSESEYPSPIVLQKWENGADQFCVDY